MIPHTQENPNTNAALFQFVYVTNYASTQGQPSRASERLNELPE
jgi:hypothetical protein